MPESIEQSTEAPPEAAAPVEESAPSAPSEPEPQPDEQPTGNSWLRETAQGLIYSRPLDTAKRSEEWSEANAELRRGRKSKPEDTPSEEGAASAPDTRPDEKPESDASPREGDDKEFERKVQAEVDRREAVRRQRADVQMEERLRRENPAEYARYKEQQAQQNLAANTLATTLRRLSSDFDDAAIKPLMDALAENERNAILSKAASTHGIPQRKLLVEEGLKAFKKAAYEEGLRKGRDEARSGLRRSKAFRDELISEIRGAEEEPEHVLANGTATGDHDWDMNDWMRVQLGKRRESR